MIGDGGGRDDPDGLHDGAFVVDLHADTPWYLEHHPEPGALQRAQAGPGRLRSGGVDAQFFILYVRPGKPEPGARAWSLLRILENEILEPDPGFVLVRDLNGLLEAAGSGKQVALVGMEGAGPLEGDIGQLDAFAEAGVSYLSLTWNPTNEFGGGAGSDPTVGATPLGLSLIDRLNDLRVVPDVSHTSYATFWDVVTRSHRPVIASHSNARSVLDHPRNLDDAQLWAIAEAGGVVGLNLHGRFIHGQRRGASMEELLDHLEHMRAVVGTEHLALGTDFDGSIIAPADIPDAAHLPLLTEALARRDWSSESIRALLGGNVLRVLEETWTSESRPAVTHRPARVVTVGADQGAELAQFACDRNTKTAWSIDEWNPDAPPVLTLEIEGPGVDRIAVTTAGPGRPSSVRSVSILAQAPASEWSYSATIAPAPTVRPHRVLLPGAEVLDRLLVHVVVDSVHDGSGEVSIAEILPEQAAAGHSSTNGP